MTVPHMLPARLERLGLDDIKVSGAVDSLVAVCTLRGRRRERNAATLATGRRRSTPSDVRFQELRARKDSPSFIKVLVERCEPCMAGGGALRRRLINL